MNQRVFAVIGALVALVGLGVALLLLRSGDGLETSGAGGASGASDGYDARAHYDKAEHMVPMRDGVNLYTIVYTPKDTSRDYPIMLFRTPYSIRPYEPDEYRQPLGPTEQFDRDGYIFVYQDVRGKFRSQGDFEVIRPLYRDAGADEICLVPATAGDPGGVRTLEAMSNIAH